MRGNSIARASPSFYDLSICTDIFCCYFWHFLLPDLTKKLTTKKIKCFLGSRSKGRILSAKFMFYKSAKWCSIMLILLPALPVRDCSCSWNLLGLACLHFLLNVTRRWGGPQTSPQQGFYNHDIFHLKKFRRFFLRFGALDLAIGLSMVSWLMFLREGAKGKWLLFQLCLLLANYLSVMKKLSAPGLHV